MDYQQKDGKSIYDFGSGAISILENEIVKLREQLELAHQDKLHLFAKVGELQQNEMQLRAELEKANLKYAAESDRADRAEKERELLRKALSEMVEWFYPYSASPNEQYLDKSKIAINRARAALEESK